jgi:hypothetical protein
MVVRAGDLLREITDKTPWQVIRVGLDGRRYIEDTRRLFPTVVWPWKDDDLLGEEAIRRLVHIMHLEEYLAP